jgi:acyl-CoA reductase-like NAD-dependent aldehyde dehydrogenase
MSAKKGETPEGLASYRMLIDNEWVDSQSGERFISTNPVTGEPLAEVPHAGAEDVEVAVLVARRAFEKGPWPETTPAGRARLLRSLG